MADDTAYILSEYLQTLDNVPNETKHIFDEISVKEVAVHDIWKRIQAADSQIQSYIKSHGSLTPHPKEDALYSTIREEYQKAINIQNEKVQLADRARLGLTRHIKRLDDRLAKAGHGFTAAELLNAPDYYASSPYGGYSPSGASSARQTPAPSRSGASTAGRRRTSATTRGAIQNGVYHSPYTASLADSGSTRGQKVSNATATTQLETKADSTTPNEMVSEEDMEEDNEKYCFCQQGSYGQMVACDNANCEREWFHMECVGLKAPPEGTWYCEACRDQKLVDAK
ncbi:Rpd3L and NuA4 histone acetyltransferase complex ING family subunit Png1 [Schizosaccharomyces pombe]|uniref:Chromatin modification-related protein png1 n=1 Tax=Schizosaccharomyces pombe (strain 972 / ATCC 24843) TaxID=284812 RepID=ING1_SCHPO|nr:chromatin modification-related protein [Schizosaccharomyces pombe]O42871.1 RecName: Full=Chromatin modification-related protein png1; AltName: Full=ING1 homolog 1 [Schizosaccharomyces pombe 972h-]CAA15917.1 ING family homolog Png1 [Schizosaccharomyces pombe]|eukprot:NP_594080.1 chromatin modification-related protein [Schizosaccharomyces pombe]